MGAEISTYAGKTQLFVCARIKVPQRSYYVARHRPLAPVFRTRLEADLNNQHRLFGAESSPVSGADWAKSEAKEVGRGLRKK